MFNITREKLETNQIALYGFVLVLAGVFGLQWTDFALRFDALISPVLAILLYGMFTQIPFLQLRAALNNRKFIMALLSVNYLFIPVLAWLLNRFLINYPPLQLGVYLVLLTPCIDYVIVFTHLGRGNEKLMLAATPLLFLSQMLLLPVYLWLFMGETAAQAVNAKPFLEAFWVLIVLPLALAVGTQFWAKHQSGGKVLLDTAAWIPVPFMALTLFLVVASQIGKLYEQFRLIVQVIPLYVVFMMVSPFISQLTARFLNLDIGAGRALIFSAGTRNSLVVLPLALALPDDWNTVVAAVIVTQTLVELIGELFYIRLVPKVILPDVLANNSKSNQ